MIALIAICIVGMVLHMRRVEFDTIENRQYAVWCGGTRCDRDRAELAGAAITYRRCKVCRINMRFSSTRTDALCSSCSNRRNSCKGCGERVAR